MSIEGRLGAGGGADLLVSLWQQERTGILDVDAGGVDRKLVVVDGEVRYATSAEASEKLPVRLVSEGLVSRQALVEASKTTDLRQALVDAGALSAEAYDRCLRDVIAGLVGKLFPACEGSFQLVDKQEVQLQGMLPAHDMVPVFWAAARACPPELAASFLGDPSQRLVRAPADETLAALSGLSPQEGYVISRIDGYTSLSEIVQVSPLPADETRLLVFALCCVGVVDATGRPRLRLPKASAKPGAKKRVVAQAPRSQPATPIVPAGGAIPIQPAQAQSPAAAGEHASSWLTSGEPGSLQAVQDMHARTASADHYAVLGVVHDADADDVRRAYYSLARLYHPDRFGRDTPPEVREMVEELFARIGAAFDTLSDAESRQAYDQRLKSGALAAEQEEREKKVDRKDIAKQSHDKGKTFLSLGDKARGLQFLEHAVDSDPENHEYRMTLSRVLVGDSRTRKRAERHLLEAIRIDPSKADAYHLLGVVYKTANLRSRALEQFRKGLSWDATHEGILKEMAELGESADGGKLGGLFGKKK